LVISTVGAFSVGRNPVFLYSLLALGLLGLLFRLVGIPLAPAVMGLVLGPILEENWARALIISRGDYFVFLNTPLSVVLLILTVILLVAPGVAWVLRRRMASKKRIEALQR